MAPPLIEDFLVFCECRDPVPDEGIVVGDVLYAVCAECKLPIESTAVPVDE